MLKIRYEQKNIDNFVCTLHLHRGFPSYCNFLSLKQNYILSEMSLRSSWILFGIKKNVENQ